MSVTASHNVTWCSRDICRSRVETRAKFDGSGGSHGCVLINLARHYLSMLIWLDVTSGGRITLNLAVTLSSNSCCLPSCAIDLGVMDSLGSKGLCSNQVSNSQEQLAMEALSLGRSRSRYNPEPDLSCPHPRSRQDTYLASFHTTLCHSYSPRIRGQLNIFGKEPAGASARGHFPTIRAVVSSPALHTQGTLRQSASLQPQGPSAFLPSESLRPSAHHGGVMVPLRLPPAPPPTRGPTRGCHDQQVTVVIVTSHDRDRELSRS
jgi:hypothetical protein